VRLLQHYDGLQVLLGYVDAGPWPDLLRMLRQLAKHPVPVGNLALAQCIAGCDFLSIEIAVINQESGRRLDYWNHSLPLMQWTQSVRLGQVVAWEVDTPIMPQVMTVYQLLLLRYGRAGGYY